MEITCWGSRGSIPVSGEAFVRYGGDTTCIEIMTDSDDTIIVDAGTGIRRLGKHLLARERFTYHFIFTHAHWDHVMGFPFFRPIFNKNAVFYMHKCPYQSNFVKTVLSEVMKAPYFPVKYAEVKARLVYEDACPFTFEIGSATITPIVLSHPNGGAGYKFEENGKSFVFLTDNELGYIHHGGEPRRAYVDFSSGADLLVHDAEYTTEEYQRYRTWGHSTYTCALELALEAGVKQLGLFHLNQDRSDDQVDRIVEKCRRRIAEKGADLDCLALGCDTTITL
jgi:phosphoribosyl 1,2-cyclic phosphodiesterase